jgi:hypothetical protein
MNAHVALQVAMSPLVADGGAGLPETTGGLSAC